jgi:hypothetical protein
MSVFLAKLDPDTVKPGWIAFFVVLILVIATFFLWRNMNKQLRKIKVPHASEFSDQRSTRVTKAPPADGDEQRDDEPRPSA